MLIICVQVAYRQEPPGTFRGHYLLGVFAGSYSQFVIMLVQLWFGPDSAVAIWFEVCMNRALVVWVVVHTVLSVRNVWVETCSFAAVVD